MPDIILILTLNAKKLEEELNWNSSIYFNSTYTLFYNGRNIFEPGKGIENILPKWDIKQEELNMQGLDLVMLINKEHMQSKRLSILLFSIILCIAVALLGTFFILYFASFLTRPFSKLSRMINEIKRNTYKLDAIPLFKDETGELIESINSMYITIQNQIEKIKKDEKEKYSYIERILTEQINPHFIYNTLEVINMEVLNGNMESASSMIHSFASYLRYSLNRGNNLTTFQGEKELVKAYIDIMNHRLNKKINFIFSIQPELTNEKIPKIILQPLVENSIKHGFYYMEEQAILLPEIIITCYKYDECIEITIQDNGIGIDYDRFYSSLENRTDSIGLYNIKRRLELFFGQVNITAESIPFFRNTVKIVIPLQ